MFKTCFFVNNKKEVDFMKKIFGWDIEQTKSLISFILQNKTRPLSQNFHIWAKKNNREAHSVRNYYYKLQKEVKTNDLFLKEMGVKEEETKSVFERKHFSPGDERFLLENVFLLGKEMSVRKACLKLSNGDRNLMLRYQNKFRKLLKNKQELVEEVIEKLRKNGSEIKSPYKETILKMPRKNVLSHEDIKSLFLGLVKIVREETKNELIQEGNKKEKELIKIIKQKNLEERESALKIKTLEEENQKLKLEYEEINKDINNLFQDKNGSKNMEKLKNFFEKLKRENESKNIT
jgi:hypothetical protein